MNRYDIIKTIGGNYLTANIENDEYSYVKASGGRENLKKLLGHEIPHEKADIRFSNDEVVILIETKSKFVKKDEGQLADYLEEEIAVHNTKQVICILANTINDKIKVWKNFIDDDSLLKSETSLKNFEYYANLFKADKQNEREKVLKNTLELNVLLHKMDIKESLRSQFVGTTLLYLKELVKGRNINRALIEELNKFWEMTKSADVIVTAIKSVLDTLLGSSKNKDIKLKLLQRNVLEDQKVKRLTLEHWIEILDTILLKIYRYIDMDSDEGQDILNLFFIAFNKYTGKADKNQAFTPDHITDFMCRLTGVNHKTVVMDITCGSGSFLVQAMIKALADCHGDKKLMDIVTKKHIYGIENEEKAYGLATTNMLIHGDGNSNVILDNCFDCVDFIIKANPDIILMNPPYNAKPMSIPPKYKKSWSKEDSNKKKSSDKDDEEIAIKKSVEGGKEDPTKGLVFIHFLSDVIKQLNKTVTLAVLLPVSAAIGTSKIITEEKKYMLENNTLEAVFTLPNEIFYPGASVNACCMLFTLGKPHFDSEGSPNKKTFFGYCKDDGFKKKKNLGRVEQFDENGKSKWKAMENKWLQLFRDREAVDGLSAKAYVTGEDEWLCEAYMKTDYSKLTEADFQQTVNNYLAYLIKEGKKKLKSLTTPTLNTSHWKEFYLKDLYDIKMGNKLDKINMTSYEPSVNFVSRVSYNNGVEDKVDLIESIKPYESGLLTVALGGSYLGSCFVQEYPFYTGQNVAVMKAKSKNVSHYVNLFISGLVRYESKIRYYAFGRELNTHINKDFTIKLPADSDGQPDYKFMEDYIKSLSCEPLTTNNKSSQVPILNFGTWQEFKISELFEVIAGIYHYPEEYENGETPYVTAADTNNGIAKRVDLPPDFKGNVITIGKVGAVAHYQSEDFCATSDVNILIPKFKFNQYIGLFVTYVINFSENYKWSYGRQCRIEDSKGIIIKLPADSNGKPDWEFMENYIKSLPYGDRLED